MRLRRVAAALAAALTVLAGCTAGGAAPPADRLVIGADTEPDTLDPHRTTSAVAGDVLCRVGGSLLAPDERGVPVPYLAQRWETSPDGLTWTFHLRPDVRFHDGTPLRAADFVYTFTRARDPATASPVAGDLLGPATAFTAPDDTTLVITLAEPYAPLLPNLAACGYLMPLSRAAVEASDADHARRPLGVGPYRVREWRTGESLILERNPDFTWGPALAGPGPARIGELEYRFLPDAAARFAALDAGTLDVAGIEARDAARLVSDDRFAVLEAPLAGADPLGVFNTASPPFDDVRLRRAVNLAVDRAALLQVVADGRGEIQLGPISRTVLGYWPGVERVGYRHRPDEAARLLAEAGFGPDRPLPVTLVAVGRFTKVAEVLREQLRAVGIEVTIEAVEPAAARQRLTEGRFQIALAGIRYTDVDILVLLFHSTKGSLPLLDVTDPELDRLLDGTRSAVDPAQRQTFADRAQERIVTQAYVLPTYTPAVFTAVRTRVAGYAVSANGTLLLHDARLTG